MSFGSYSFGIKSLGFETIYSPAFYADGWTYRLSDDFNRVKNIQALSSTLLVSNDFGGYESVYWSTSGNAMFGDGLGTVGSNNPGANACVLLSPISDSRTRILFYPDGGVSNMAVVARSETTSLTGNTSIVAVLQNDHTTLTIRDCTGGSLVDRANLTVTPPGVPFYLELEIEESTKTATARILNTDFSVRNSTSAVLPVLPTGNYYGFFFYQSTATGRFDDFAIGEKSFVEQVVFRPQSDVTVTNWTATGAVFADQINEVTTNSSTYIQSPNLLVSTTPSTFLLNGTMPAGSYELKVNASKTLNVGQFRIVILDSSDVVNTSTAWTAVSSTDTQYLFNITTTAPSNKFRVEVST